MSTDRCWQRIQLLRKRWQHSINWSCKTDTSLWNAAFRSCRSMKLKRNYQIKTLKIGLKRSMQVQRRIIVLKKRQMQKWEFQEFLIRKQWRPLKLSSITRRTAAGSNNLWCFCSKKMNKNCSEKSTSRCIQLKKNCSIYHQLIKYVLRYDFSLIKICRLF